MLPNQNNSLQQEGQEVSHIQKIDAGQFTCRKHRIADFKDCKVSFIDRFSFAFGVKAFPF